MHDVAIFDDVVAPFEAHLAGFLRALLAFACDVVCVGDHFGADEALFEVGVNDARRLRRGAAPMQRPGTDLLRVRQ